MPKFDSPHWDVDAGICMKHQLPQLPCPECIAESDADVEVSFDDTDADILAFDPGLEPEDLLPADWFGLVAA